MTLYQLDCQARLSDSTTANYDEFVFSQKTVKEGQRLATCTCTYMHRRTRYEFAYFRRHRCVDLRKLSTSHRPIDLSRGGYIKGRNDLRWVSPQSGSKQRDKEVWQDDKLLEVSREESSTNRRVDTASKSGLIRC